MSEDQDTTILQTNQEACSPLLPKGQICASNCAGIYPGMKCCTLIFHKSSELITGNKIGIHNLSL